MTTPHAQLACIYGHAGHIDSEGVCRKPLKALVLFGVHAYPTCGGPAVPRCTPPGERPWFASTQELRPDHFAQEYPVSDEEAASFTLSLLDAPCPFSGISLAELDGFAYVEPAAVPDLTDAERHLAALARRLRLVLPARLCSDPECIICAGLPATTPTRQKVDLPPLVRDPRPYRKGLPWTPAKRAQLLAAIEATEPAASPTAFQHAVGRLMDLNWSTVNNYMKIYGFKSKLDPALKREAVSRHRKGGL